MTDEPAVNVKTPTDRPTNDCCADRPDCCEDRAACCVATPAAERAEKTNDKPCACACGCSK